MRNFVLALLAFVAISFATPAFALGDCNGNNTCNTTDNDTTNQGGDGGSASASSGASAASGSVSGAAVLGSGNSSSDSEVSVGNGFGNFSPDATAVQGQKQIGVNALDSDIDVRTDTRDWTSQGQGQDQDQHQTSVGKVDSHDRFEVEGDVTTYEAPEIPVNSAAPVFAGACSQGVSAQFPTGGVSAGSGNPVCDYVAVAGAYVAAGARTEALAALAQAEKAALWRARFALVRSFLTLGLL